MISYLHSLTVELSNRYHIPGAGLMFILTNESRHDLETRFVVDGFNQYPFDTLLVVSHLMYDCIFETRPQLQMPPLAQYHITQGGTTVARQRALV